MKLAAAAYPNAPNVYEGLAEIYLAEWQKELAGKMQKSAGRILLKDGVKNVPTIYPHGLL